MVLYKDSLLHSRSYGSSRNEHRRTAFLWQDRMLDEPKGTNFHANTVISKACCLPVKMTSKTVIRSVAWTPWWQTICPTGHWKPKYRKTTGDKLDPDLDLIDTLCDWQGVIHDRGLPPIFDMQMISHNCSLRQYANHEMCAHMSKRIPRYSSLSHLLYC